MVCEALTDQDGFAWTTSILDESCLVIAFSLSGTTRSIIHSLLDAKEMGAKTVLLTAKPATIKEAFTEILPVAPLPGSTYIDRITATLPFLPAIDLIYAHFLEMDRERKERIFNQLLGNKNSMAMTLANDNFLKRSYAPRDFLFFAGLVTRYKMLAQIARAFLYFFSARCFC